MEKNDFGELAPRDEKTKSTNTRAVFVDEDGRREGEDAEGLDVKAAKLLESRASDRVASAAPSTETRRAQASLVATRSTRWQMQQKILWGSVRALSVEEGGNIAVATVNAIAHVLQELVWDAALLLGHPKTGSPFEGPALA